MLTDRTKEYVAELLLGQITDTQDTTGTVLEEREVAVDEAQVREVIGSFVGGYDQIPPMYSALKVNGKNSMSLPGQVKKWNGRQDMWICRRSRSWK